MINYLGNNLKYKVVKQKGLLRRYLNLYDDINKAIKNYIEDVRNEDFPNKEEEY